MNDIAIRWYKRNRQFDIVDVNTLEVVYKSGIHRTQVNAQSKCLALLRSKNWNPVTVGHFS